MKKRLLTTKEAAAYIGISEAYLKEIRATGKIRNRLAPPPHREMGPRLIRYDIEDLNIWIEALPKKHDNLGDEIAPS
ncbi:helix-turn-helix transcriptional regulator [Aminobacterium mobile]